MSDDTKQTQEVKAKRTAKNSVLGCLVMSNLSLKKGRVPLTCKIHLPPSMTAISSWLISSMQHCQVVNSFQIFNFLLISLSMSNIII